MPTVWKYVSYYIHMTINSDRTEPKLQIEAKVSLPHYLHLQTILGVYDFILLDEYIRVI